MTLLLPKCVCDSTLYSNAEYNGVPVMVCGNCGVLRQILRMTPQELSDWYRVYFKGQYTHTYEHDLEVGKTRLDRYGLSTGLRLLDVGCGNGGFLDAAKARGIEVIGQDVSPDADSDDVYVGQLEAIGFPTDSFDVVTVHDVLEHLIDPLSALKEIRRVLRRPGKLILDYPNFFSDSGKHHWKHVEHLWMFTHPQLIRIVEQAGFAITNSYRPIPSKLVLEAEPLPEKRTQILVPPGIGDSWWAITKLPGLLKRNNLGLPDVWVQDSGGPKRTQPFLHCLPMLNAAGYKEMSDRDPIFREAYNRNERTVFQNVKGMDYFIAYNGVMRAGRSLEEVDPGYGCDWRPKMFISKAAQNMRDKWTTSQAKYAVCFFAEAGMYQIWLRQFPKEKIAEAIKLLEEQLGLTIVMIGAKWDLGQVGREIVRMDPNWIDLIGETSFDEMLGLILGAELVFGFPAGNTMLGTMFNRPTLLLWNEYFHENFWKYSVPPDAPYKTLDTRNLEPATVLRAAQDLLR